MSRLSIGSRIEKREGSEDEEKFFFIFEGIEVGYNSNSNYVLSPIQDTEKFRFSTSSSIIEDKFPDLKLNEILPLIGRASIDFYNLVEDGLFLVGDHCQIYKERNDWVCAMQVTFDKSNWNKPWSPRQFVEEMIEIAEDFPDIYSVDSIEEYADGDAYVTFFIKEEDRDFLFELRYKRLDTFDLLNATEERMQAQLMENSLVIPFTFPTEIRTSCEQYLLFFAKFLEDVGVDAAAEIKHESGEAGQVLFSVTPSGGKEALDKVRQALELYLDLGQMPGKSPNFSASDEVQDLQLQIRHFQHQLEWAEAKIEKKNATIELNKAAIQLKDELIAQLKEGRVFEEAQNGVVKAGNESSTGDELAKVVQLKKWDLNFCEIDLQLLLDLTRKWIFNQKTTENLKAHLKLNGLEWPINSTPALPPTPEDKENK